MDIVGGSFPISNRTKDVTVTRVKVSGIFRMTLKVSKPIPTILVCEVGVSDNGSYLSFCSFIRKIGIS